MRPISLIAAIGENNVIGDAGQIPWRLPSDFAFFKRMTLGMPVYRGSQFSTIPARESELTPVSRRSGAPRWRPRGP